MGEITPDAVEYASIERLSKMLSAVREDYKVTESYALFTAILCWVLQRIRTPEHQDGINDHLARQVREGLEEKLIEDEPWLIRTEDIQVHDDPLLPRSFPAFRQMPAFAFLKSLRDAVAHGDARSIRPINERGILVGHSFECERARNDPIGTIVLRRADMRRIGCALAELYCTKMRESHPAEHVEDESRRLQEDVAA